MICKIFQSAKKARIVIIVTVLLMVVFTIASATTARGEGRLPEIFPPTHNRAEGRVLIESFIPTAPANTAPVLEHKICDPIDGGSHCALHWCEAPLEELDVNK